MKIKFGTGQRRRWQKIKFGTGHDQEWTEINVGSHEVLIQEAFCGVGIETDIGIFGIAQRDGVIEIMFNGESIINSDEMKKSIYFSKKSTLFRQQLDSFFETISAQGISETIWKKPNEQ